MVWFNRSENIFIVFLTVDTRGLIGRARWQISRVTSMTISCKHIIHANVLRVVNNASVVVASLILLTFIFERINCFFKSILPWILSSSNSRKILWETLAENFKSKVICLKSSAINWFYKKLFASEVIANLYVSLAAR